MTTPTGWKRKFILLFKSEKRLGAKQIVTQYGQLDFATLKAAIITSLDKPETFDKFFADALESNREFCDDEPKRIRDLTAHLTRLRQEFIGTSELCFYHAILIVLIRRGYQLQDTYAKFEALWQAETDYLLQHLSTRWLISACDTFIDLSDSPVRQAILMNAVTLINTLKVYETQLDLFNTDKQMNEQKIQHHRDKHRRLYSGLTYFRIGKDDTLKHMVSRYQSFAQYDPFAVKLLMAIFNRLQHLPTAFHQLKSLHTDATSQWWHDSNV